MRRILEDIAISSKQYQVLLGASLGDACLRIQYNYPYGLIEHSIKQKDYLLFKKNLLGELCSPNIIERTRRLKFNGKYKKEGTSCAFRICTNRELVPIHNLIYPNGKKTITKELLAKLEDLAIAIWYMDDGYWCVNHKKTSGRIGLATLSFSKEENELIKDYFKYKYDIDFHITFEDKKYHGLMIYNRRDAFKFANIVNKHIPECMAYKKIELVPSRYPKFNY